MRALTCVTGDTLSFKPISAFVDNRDQQKSFAFHTGSFPEPPTSKNKALCVAWLKCICVISFNTNPSSFTYAIYTVFSAAIQSHRPCVYFSTSTCPESLQCHLCEKKFSPCVPVQNCIYILCRVFVRGSSLFSALNPNLLFFC